MISSTWLAWPANRYVSLHGYNRHGHGGVRSPTVSGAREGRPVDSEKITPGLGGLSLALPGTDEIAGKCLQVHQENKPTVIEDGGRLRAGKILITSRTTASALIKDTSPDDPGSSSAASGEEYQSTAWASHCQRIIQRHGGRVRAEGSLMRGRTSTFPCLRTDLGRQLSPQWGF